ncbi:MAG: thiamine pyrophosphate-dependent enzyme [Nitrospirota bacterium]
MLMAEFATCVKYRLPVKVLIIKYNSLGMIKWEQMIFLENPKYGCDMQLIDFASFARACGETGFTIEDLSECGATLDQARATPGPVIVEAGVEPFEPPMLPKLPLE